MTIKLNNIFNYNNKKPDTFVIFLDENLNLKGVAQSAIKKFTSFISKIAKFEFSKDKKKKFLIFNLPDGQKLTIIRFNSKNKSLDNEIIGGDYLDFIKKNKIYINNFFSENIIQNSKNEYFFDEFFLGANLKSFEFNKYKKNAKENQYTFNVLNLKKDFNFSKNKKFSSLKEGIDLTKDLVSEPGNILHPDEYIKRILKLKKNGLKVRVYDTKEMLKMGMNALIGVGKGSSKGSYLATIEWNGSRNKDKPLAFVGKGVCFDTGGISLKPAKFMEDMTYDMAGSAVVVGLMKTLALRKAKVNAVGVVGLVENMPDGNAQRPGDIVKSYSGQTIEILNTDAEGRLVLADALSYTEKKFKPKFIVDLATLTGAIIVSLGSEYAGLFSNDDKISDQLSKAGEKVGEKVWRMPLNDNYDKLIDSKKADMQNINYVGGAGSTTAAQFLQRFILNKTPWAHLDIAGMAFSKYGGALNSGGATGYGVRLLNQLIEDNYE